MIAFTSDFECGNGKNFQQIGPDRYRMEVVGDKPVYCYYFCFDVLNRGAATEIAIEIWHDPVINDVGGFISHFPCAIWINSRKGEPLGYYPLEQTRCETCADHLVLRLPLAAGQTMRVTDLWPASYSDTSQFLHQLARERSDLCTLFSLGKSVQGREITGIRAGTPGKPRALCIAGQHPIEFSGTWGMRAIADFMTSQLPEAAAIREQFEVEVIPQVNPDGAVAGRNGFNAEGFDMYQAFGSRPEADEPEAHESKLLWQRAISSPLALWFNIHNYLGWRAFSEPPFDGWYTVPAALFTDPVQARRYQTLCDVLRLQTDAPSGQMLPNVHAPNTICYQLARRFNIPHVFYEINGATGGAFQSGKRALQVFRKVMNTLSSV